MPHGWHYGVAKRPALLATIVLGILGVMVATGCGDDAEGPVAVWAERLFQAEQAGQPLSLSNQTYFAIDMETGKKWKILDVGEEWPRVHAAGDRLVFWDGDSLDIHSVSLSGESEVLFQSGGALLPLVSLDGSKIAFAIDGTPSGEADSIVVLDVRSGDELVRISADDPRIDPPPSADDWSLEVSRWLMSGDALIVTGVGTGSFVVALDGEVQAIPDRVFASRSSPDLRYGIAPEGSERAGYTSLAVIEISTGRDLLTLVPEGSRRILGWYWGAPGSGEAMYATVPASAVRERPARQAVWRIVDLDAGTTRVVDIHDEKLRAEWEWLWRLQDAGYDGILSQCQYRHQASKPCDDLYLASHEIPRSVDNESTSNQERRERDDSEIRTEFLGFVWPD